jgi:hypothetical protein
MLKLANFENCGPVVEGMKAEEIIEKKAEEMVKEPEEMVEKVENVEAKNEMRSKN